MTDWFILNLDTTAPQVSFGSLQGAQAGQTFHLPYTITEAGVLSADLVDPGSTYYPMTIWSSELTIDLPVDYPPGQSLVRVVTQDDVGNSAIFEMAVVILSGEAIGVGGGHAFTFAPIGIPVRTEIPVRFSIVKPFEARLDTTARSVRGVEIRVSASSTTARQREFQIALTRQPGRQYANVLREDEELLLLL